MDNKYYEYALTTLPGIGRKTKKRLLLEHSEKEILMWTKEELQKHLDPKEWRHYQKQSISPNGLYNIVETRTEWERLKEKGIEFIYQTGEKYPERLKNIPDAPLGIYVRGEIPTYEKSIAIVGARTPSAYGKEVAGYFAKELAKEGVAIISGLAFGIDVEAHKGALSVNGKTCGVLGCGVDVVYPRENYYVYEKMCEKGGIISEYKPGTMPDTWHFPERNRIISGLADGVLVVEAKKKSGSLITADCALEQGRDVYAIPGRVGDLLSKGTNWLLREGAKIVTEPNHILEELFPLCEKKNKEIYKSDKVLDFKEKLVYACLSLHPKSIEEILSETNLSVSEGISILFRLELKNYIKRVDNNNYIVSL